MEMLKLHASRKYQVATLAVAMLFGFELATLIFKRIAIRPARKGSRLQGAANLDRGKHCA